MNKMQKLNSLFLILLFLTAFTACEDENFFRSPEAVLDFSVDTVMFDTLFTSVGSITKNFKIYNPYNRPLQISSIRLANGGLSDFRLNVNGLPFSEENNFEAIDIELASRDSLYIFVEVTVDPNNSNNPILAKDSVVFETNSNLQDVKLMAWGQDFHLIEGKTLGTETWNSDKPYLVYGNAMVDSLETLTINPGVKIYFHNKAALSVKGTIKVQGTIGEPVLFQSDRLENFYSDVPDQWLGVFLRSGSEGNEFRNVTIKNGNVGIQVGDLENEGKSEVQLENVRIENMGYAGILSIASTIIGENVIIGNCGKYSVALIAGGNYQFTHTTIANYWGGFTALTPRRTPALLISNVMYGDSIIRDLEKATFENSIIYGNSFNEIEFVKHPDAEFNYYFDHCLVRVNNSFDVGDAVHYRQVLKNINPQFVDPYDEYIYELDSLSPMRDTVALRSVSEKIPFDLKGKSRLDDGGPDLGALEWIPSVVEDESEGE